MRRALVAAGLLVAGCPAPPTAGEDAGDLEARAPLLARIAPIPETELGAAATLDGSASTGPEGVPIFYAWSIEAPPGDGCVGVLEGEAAPVATFRPACFGAHTARLVVTTLNERDEPASASESFLVVNAVPDVLVDFVGQVGGAPLEEGGGVDAGGSVTFSWTASNAASCALTRRSLADPTTTIEIAADLPPSGTLAHEPPIDSDYRLACAGAAGQTAERTLRVLVASRSDLAASDASVLRGEQIELSFSSTHAACELRATVGGQTRVVSTSSPATDAPTSTTTYALACAGFQGPLPPSERVVRVLAIDELRAPDDSIPVGAQAALVWNVEDETATCALAASPLVAGEPAPPEESGLPPVEPAGHLTAALSASQTFTLTCALDDEIASATEVVHVEVDVTAFSGGVEVAADEKRVRLDWSVAAGADCTVLDGATPIYTGPARTFLVDPAPPITGKRVYSLTCSGTRVGDVAAADGSVVVWWGDVFDAQAATFSALPRVSIVTGTLFLVDAMPVIATAELRHVGANLEVSPTRSAVELGALRRVDGYVSIYASQLTQLLLPSLEHVGLHLGVGEAPLQVLDLQRLSSVGSLSIGSVSTLTSVRLPALETVSLPQEGISLYALPALSTFEIPLVERLHALSVHSSGLALLEAPSLREAVAVYAILNPNLTGLAFPSLSHVSGELIVEHNERLPCAAAESILCDLDVVPVQYRNADNEAACSATATCP